MKTNIYLIGFMGTGKSTIARALCNTYRMEQAEMDEQIVKEQGKSIADIFAAEGEEYFRELETDLLRRIGGREHMVVSCGGGTAMRQCNVEEMKKNGVIVLLDARPETIYRRVKNDHGRPLLEGNMNVEYIKGLMDARRGKYQAAADFTVMTDRKSSAQICQEIMKNIEGFQR